MENLCMYLPPFAPDYSGVCSALFDLGGLIMIHDANGCTGNYVGFDEPRFYGSKTPIYCSGLREKQAILGNDEKYIDKVIKAAESINPPFIALVGSPVPMVIGTDLEAMALQIEDATGIRSFGFNTTVNKHYNTGVANGTKIIIDGFIDVRVKPVENYVNILGATPLDFSTTCNIEDTIHLLNQNGKIVNCCLSENCKVENIANFKRAEVNIAVSQAGVVICRYLQKKYDMPFIIGLPIGSQNQNSFFRDLKNKKNEGFSRFSSENAGVLIIGDQIISNSLRAAINLDLGLKDVNVATIFGSIGDLKDLHDMDLKSESDIEKEVNKEQYKIIIADPLIKQLINNEDKVIFIDNASYAVSSKFHVDKNINYISNKFNDFFKERCNL